MPRTNPLFLLVFANLRDAYLEQLEKESSEMNKALAHLHDNDTIEIYREESATSEEIEELLLRFHERIALLHYGGHANASFLALEDVNANALGLANLLGQLPRLQMVFLNGCATLGQVKLLFDAGVKAIIATAVPINDQKAVAFASNFYKALGRNNNLKMAFQFAVYAVQAFNDKTLKATIVRRGELATFEDTQILPWGLFLNNTPEAVDIELWKIIQKDSSSNSQTPDGSDTMNYGFSADDDVSSAAKLDIDNELFTSDQWLAIGIQAYQAQDFMAAQDYFAKATAVNYENIEAWYHWGLCLKNFDKYEAKYCFEKVLELNPNREDVKTELENLWK